MRRVIIFLLLSMGIFLSCENSSSQFPVLEDLPQPVQKSPAIKIVSPLDGSIIEGAVRIEVFTSGCIDTVEFYIDQILKYTDTSPPFCYVWSTTDQTPGRHTIIVKGYCLGIYKVKDTITVYVPE